jgi:hypothetical protein
VGDLSLDEKIILKWILNIIYMRVDVINSVPNLINELPGNSFVNTVQNATIDEAVFSMSSVPRPVLLMGQ